MGIWFQKIKIVLFCLEPPFANLKLRFVSSALGTYCKVVRAL